MGKVKVPVSEYDNLCALYTQLKSIYRVAEVYHINPSRVHAILKINGAETIDRRRTTDADEDVIIELYKSGLSLESIAPMYDLHPTTVHKILKRHNIKRRTTGEMNRSHIVNETLFDGMIENEVAAYLLGFIYADGYTSLEKSTLAIALAAKDKEFLQDIKDVLAPDSDVKLSLRSNGKKGKVEAYRLAVFSSHLVERLQEIGIVKGRNQFDKLLPILSPKVYSHFVRGFFDGDGSIDWRVRKSKKSPTLRIRFLGGKDILTWISNIIQSFCHNGANIYQRSGIAALDFASNGQTMIIGEWLYRDATIFMERKRERYLSFLNAYNCKSPR